MMDKIKITKKGKKTGQEPYDDNKIKSLVDQFSRKSTEAYDMDKKDIEDEYSRTSDPFKQTNGDINHTEEDLDRTESNLEMLKRKYSKHKKNNIDINNNVLDDSKDSESTLNQLKKKYSKKNTKPKAPAAKKGNYFEKMNERVAILEQKVSKLQVFCAFQLSSLKYSSNFVNSFDNIFSTDMKPEHTLPSNLPSNPFSKIEDLDDDLTLKCEEDDNPKINLDTKENGLERSTKSSKLKKQNLSKLGDPFSWRPLPEKPHLKKFGLDDPLDEAADSDNESNLSEKAMDIVKDLCNELESDNSMSPIKINFNPEVDGQGDDFTKSNKKNKKSKKQKAPKDDDSINEDNTASEEVDILLKFVDESSIQNGEIPTCPKCDYKPTAKSVSGVKESLKRHIKSVHERVKDKQCQFCPYKTGHKSNLNTHLKNKHKDEV